MFEQLNTDVLWINLIIVAGAVLLAILCHYLLFRFLRNSRFFRNREKLETVRSQLYAPMLVLFVLMGIFLVYPNLTVLTYLIPSSFVHLLRIIFIITIAWLAVKIVRTGRLILMRKYDISARDNLKARKAYTQVSMIENIIIFLIILITLGIILMTFEAVRQVGLSLLTSAGIAGIILGFAAQKLIATVLAGIQLALTQPIRIDDVVIVEGEWGWIEELNLTYVVVRIWDQRRLVVPSTYFIEKPFQNWTRTNAQILGTVFLYTDYRVPFEEIRKELTRLLHATDLWDGRVNVLQVTDAKATTVELRALVSAIDSPTAWDLRVYIREKLIEFLRDQYPESLPVSRVEFREGLDVKTKSK